VIAVLFLQKKKRGSKSSPSDEGTIMITDLIMITSVQEQRAKPKMDRILSSPAVSQRDANHQGRADMRAHGTRHA
jgi:hypothetical protein